MEAEICHTHHSNTLTPEPKSETLTMLDFKRQVQILVGRKYIRSIVKDAEKMFGSFYQSRKHMNSYTTLYLDKSHIGPNMKYCCHVSAGAVSAHSITPETT